MKESPQWHACIHFCLLAFCLTAPGKWKNFTGSPFGFLFHDSGYRESFLQVPKAHLLVVTILSEHYLSNTCGWLECPNFPGLFTSEVTWHYTWNLAPKRWIAHPCDCVPITWQIGTLRTNHDLFSWTKVCVQDLTQPKFRSRSISWPSDELYFKSKIIYY